MTANVSDTTEYKNLLKFAAKQKIDLHNAEAKLRLIQEILRRPWSKKTKLEYIQLVLYEKILPKDAKI